MDEKTKQLIKSLEAYGEANNCSSFIGMFVIPEIIKQTLNPKINKPLYNIGV